MAFSGKLPASHHFVGYVEDDETPEMIMKKFEELERYMKEKEKEKEVAPSRNPSDPSAF